MPAALAPDTPWDVGGCFSGSAIEMDDGNVICGCCGGLQEKTEEGVTWKKLETYSNWIDLTEEICGDDFEE